MGLERRERRRRLRRGIEGLQIGIGNWRRRRGVGRSGGRRRVGIQRIWGVRLGISGVIGGGERRCGGVGVVVVIGRVRDRVRVLMRRRVLVIGSGGIIPVLHR
ncbi:hypothetical protein ACFX1R_044459 [Malus domestica]